MSIFQRHLGSYYRVADGARVPFTEALIGNALRDGYGVGFPMMAQAMALNLPDAAFVAPAHPVGRALMRDHDTTNGANTMQINDAIQALPHGLHSKIHYALASLADTDRVTIEMGIRNMESVVHEMNHGSTSKMVADSDQGAALVVAAHIQARLDDARARLARL